MASTIFYRGGGYTANDIGYTPYHYDISASNVYDALIGLTRTRARIYTDRTSTTTYEIPYSVFRPSNDYRPYGSALVFAWNCLYHIFWVSNNSLNITKLAGDVNATFSYSSTTEKFTLDFGSNTRWEGISILIP